MRQLQPIRGQYCVGVTNERAVSPGQPGLGPGAGQTLRLALGRVHRPGLHLGEGAGGTHQARVLGIVSGHCTTVLLSMY